MLPEQALEFRLELKFKKCISIKVNLPKNSFKYSVYMFRMVF